MKVAHIKSPYLPLSETFIYNYVNGAKKYKPIIMVEYDKKICDKIFNILKKHKYEKFIYNKFTQEIEKFRDQEVFNIFYINKNFII